MQEVLYIQLEEQKYLWWSKIYIYRWRMTDNIRPALYQAEYEAIVANKANEIAEDVVTIAGKCCESGDLIIKNGKLAKAETGDLVLVATTGAYGYSMSNNYNKAPKPAVVFVKEGKSALSIKRESLKTLLEMMY